MRVINLFLINSSVLGCVVSVPPSFPLCECVFEETCWICVRCAIESNLRKKEHTNFVTFGVFLVSFGSKEGGWGDGIGTQISCEIVIPNKTAKEQEGVNSLSFIEAISTLNSSQP